MTYDPVRGRVLLTHGVVKVRRDAVSFAQQDTDETWAWDGQTWTQLPTTNRPGFRTNPLVAFDDARSRLVLMGGYNGAVLTDTWELVGNAWTQAATTGPDGAGLSDPRSSVMFFHQGRQKAMTLGENGIWEWNGNTWARVTTGETAPLQDNGFHAVYDARRNVVVLVRRTSSTPWQTWEWDGAVWAQRTPVNNPPQTSAEFLTYHAHRRRTVLVTDSTQPQTWEYDGAMWWLNTQALEPGGSVGLSENNPPAYDAARRVMVVVVPENERSVTSEYGP